MFLAIVKAGAARRPLPGVPTSGGSGAGFRANGRPSPSGTSTGSGALRGPPPGRGGPRRPSGEGPRDPVVTGNDEGPGPRTGAFVVELVADEGFEPP